ncbi:MAG: hypothetical protein DI538_00410 [Azospira oryzae]|jgi:hypothetical protein|nr:MAG: hypothetical protein DI538_00410 [Azospira oryzae]
MKKSISLVAVATVLLCSACSFSAGTHKDLSTGLSYSYNGFGVEKVTLVGPDNTAMSSNEAVLNSQIAIVVEGLTNYTLKDDKAYPGLMLNVTNKEGIAVISEADLFDGGNGYPPADAAVLRGTITIGTPMVTGETYHVKMRVWDKIKPESELTAEVDFTVK